MLDTAARGGDEAVVRLLVEDYKADVEAKKDGWTMQPEAETRR